MRLIDALFQAQNRVKAKCLSSLLQTTRFLRGASNKSSVDQHCDQIKNRRRKSGLISTRLKNLKEQIYLDNDRSIDQTCCKINGVLNVMFGPDYAEEQQNELEALQSIYPDEFQGTHNTKQKRSLPWRNAYMIA